MSWRTSPYRGSTRAVAASSIFCGVRARKAVRRRHCSDHEARLFTARRSPPHSTAASLDLHRSCRLTTRRTRSSSWSRRQVRNDRRGVRRATPWRSVALLLPAELRTMRRPRLCRAAGGASSCCSDAASVRKRSCTVAGPPCVLPPEADLRKERKRLRANGQRSARPNSKTSVSLSPGGRRDLAVALQVSGHLKSCNASKLRAHVDACRRAFAVCDVFVSTWSELKPTTIHWSGGHR